MSSFTVFSFPASLIKNERSAAGVLLATPTALTAQNLVLGILASKAEGRSSPTKLSIQTQGSSQYDLSLSQDGPTPVNVFVEGCKDDLPERLKASIASVGFVFLIFGHWDGESLGVLDQHDYRLFMASFELNGHMVMAEPGTPMPFAVEIMNGEEPLLVLG